MFCTEPLLETEDLTKLTLKGVTKINEVNETTGSGIEVINILLLILNFTLNITSRMRLCNCVSTGCLFYLF